jgi:hypothetical protein
MKTDKKTKKKSFVCYSALFFETILMTAASPTSAAKYIQGDNL